MKKELSPVLVVVVVAVVLFLAGGIYWYTGNREVKAPVMNGGPIKLPPSQVGTKVGGRVLGAQGPGAASPR